MFPHLLCGMAAVSIRPACWRQSQSAPRIAPHRCFPLPFPLSPESHLKRHSSEIIKPVSPHKLLAALALAAILGCHSAHTQVPPANGSQLSPELQRRVEVLLRARTKLPPDYLFDVGPRTHSDIPGYDQIEVIVHQADGGANTSHPLTFLLSKDGRTLAQFNTYDISQDPKTIVSGVGRPYRGGPETAPVQIVAFDDLECPYCTRMHTQLFPALTDRYGRQVRVVYRDFPLSIHPWAMRAAVDTNCLAAQSVPAYWSAVDYIHANGNEFGGPEHSLAKANDSIDQVTLDTAKKDSLKTTEVEACIKKQDESAIKASQKIGDDLGIEATPVLFINGEKLEGAYPLTDVFRMVDAALVAAGQTPPPPYVAPPPPLTTPSAAPGTRPAMPNAVNPKPTT